MKTLFSTSINFLHRLRPEIWLLAACLAYLPATAAAQDHEDHDHAAPADEHGPADGPGHAGHEHEHEEIVQLTPEVRREFDIGLGQAGPGTLQEQAVLPGEIQFNQEARAHVTPRYAGTVLEIRARLGDAVKKGQVLARLESTDTLRPFDVVAPFDGTVVDYNITSGQTVEAGTSLFTVADLSTVWADLRIYQSQMDQIRADQHVHIRGAHGLSAAEGTIAYLAPTIDEHTRTGLARVIIDNPEGRWKPGMFIKGHVEADAHAHAIVIPRTALLTFEGRTSVFVQTDEGFEPRPVTIGHSDPDAVEITEGLEAGETIVTTHPISLKAELGKGSFGGHHH
ncbi:MAG: cation efflux system protein CzcB [Puniceicoccaceae bacterium 5H]|nr:MAG: cation efflux system protein CzcB [Puniceicoccaceae bacterium 5H]